MLRSSSTARLKVHSLPGVSFETRVGAAVLHLRVHKELQEDDQLLQEGGQPVGALPQQRRYLGRHLRKSGMGRVTVRASAGCPMPVQQYSATPPPPPPPPPHTHTTPW